MPDHPRPYTIDRRICPWMANEIWHILVEECGARPKPARWDDHYSFVSYLDSNAGGLGHEYRFMGRLGFGGKFYNDGRSWRVSCYGEDETPERREMIRRANDRLAALHQSYTIDSADG